MALLDPGGIQAASLQKLWLNERGSKILVRGITSVLDEPN